MSRKPRLTLTLCKINLSRINFALNHASCTNSLLVSYLINRPHFYFYSQGSNILVTFWLSSERLSSISRVQSGEAYTGELSENSEFCSDITTSHITGNIKEQLSEFAKTQLQTGLEYIPSTKNLIISTTLCVKNTH